MGLYNEEKIRKLLKNSDCKTLSVGSDDIVTPQAKEYLNDQKVKLVRRNTINGKKRSVDLEYQKPVKDKPENMTHLFGNELVSKDNEIIAFRGKIDSLQSEILLMQNKMFQDKEENILRILENVLDFVRLIMQSEVKNIPFEGWDCLGMNSSEIREISHNPKKTYGIKHILPNYKMGEKILLLNKLRSDTREIELLAVKALNNRLDIIEALNRLSSFFYVCMIQIYAEGRDGK
jgi:ethanolamine utilization cobalamin adenosyltransferase